MSDATVEIGDIEFSASDLEKALDATEASEGGFHSGVGTHASVVVTGDGDPDDFVFLINRDTGEATQTFYTAEFIREQLEEVLGGEGDEPIGTIEFTDSGGSVLALAAGEPFEVATKESGGLVVGFDETALAADNDSIPNTRVDQALDGSWERDWYFSEVDADIEIA